VFFFLGVFFVCVGTTRFEWMLKMEQSVELHREMGTPESEMEEVCVCVCVCVCVFVCLCMCVCVCV
jgi:hypothetical protein